MALRIEQVDRFLSSQFGKHAQLLIGGSLIIFTLINHWITIVQPVKTSETIARNKWTILEAMFALLKEGYDAFK